MEPAIRPGERIYLACDCSADPVWSAEDGAMLPMGELGLSPAALVALHTWAGWFETTLGRGDPPAYFPEDEERQRFFVAGLRIWHQVRRELADTREVGVQLLPGTPIIWSDDDVEGGIPASLIVFAGRKPDKSR